MTLHTTDYHELASELFDIQAEILELLERATRLLHNAPDLTYQRGNAYWLAHARMAITKEHDYLGGSMVTMEDTIQEIIAADQK